MSLHNTARYGIEFLTYYPRYVRELEAQDLDQSVRNMLGGKHTASVGGSIAAGALYDISTVGGYGVKEEREKAQFIGGISSWYFDLIDDASDQPDIYLTSDQKREALITVAANSLEPMSSSALPDSRFYRAAFHLGHNVRKAIGGDPASETFQSSVELALQTEVKAVEQLHSEAHIDYAINIGKACGGILAGTVEYVRGETDESMVQAARSFGAYLELLDHAYEINQDLLSRNPTFATDMIYDQGDTPSVRQNARQALLGAAEHYREAGKEGLSREQQKIYAALINLCDLRYKVIVNFRDHRVGKKTAVGALPAFSYE